MEVLMPLLLCACIFIILPFMVTAVINKISKKRLNRQMRLTRALIIEFDFVIFTYIFRDVLQSAVSEMFRSAGGDIESEFKALLTVCLASFFILLTVFVLTAAAVNKRTEKRYTKYLVIAVIGAAVSLAFIELIVFGQYVPEWIDHFFLGNPICNDIDIIHPEWSDPGIS